MKKKVMILFLCIMDILILSVGYALQMTPMVYVALLGFAAILVSNTDEYLLPIVLFFLPWDNILKLSADSYTVFTLSIPFILILFLINNRHEKKLIDTDNIIIVLFFASVTLITKFLLNFNISGSYIQFLFMLIFIPMYLTIYTKKINFSVCIVFLSAGAVMASATAKILMGYSHMLKFIVIDEWKAVGLLRLSGFYGDSNFYSVHFLIAIAGMLLLLSKCSNFYKGIAESIGIFILIYYGMMSVSKMFIICLFIIIILWICALLIGQEKLSKKLTIFIGFIIIVTTLATFNIFIDQINYYLVRFGMVYNTESLTTGRSDLWIGYINYIFSEAWIFLFGNGYTDIDLNIVSNDTHNIILQSLYQMGIVGLIIVGVWIMKLFNSVHIEKPITFENKIYHLMIIVAFFLPWLSLDMLYFNEFFYIPALYLVFKKYINQWTEPMKADIKVPDYIKNSGELE